MLARGGLEKKSLVHLKKSPINDSRNNEIRNVDGKEVCLACSSFQCPSDIFRFLINLWKLSFDLPFL